MRSGWERGKAMSEEAYDALPQAAPESFLGVERHPDHTDEQWAKLRQAVADGNGLTIEEAEAFDRAQKAAAAKRPKTAIGPGGIILPFPPRRSLINEAWPEHGAEGTRTSSSASS